MVIALGTPKRHPQSGIYWFRKRVPDRLRKSVGRAEIKFSLRTRDPQIARLRNLDAMLKLERAWAGHDIALIGADGSRVAFFECKSFPDGAAASDGTAAGGRSPGRHLPLRTRADPQPASELTEVGAVEIATTTLESESMSNPRPDGPKAAAPASMRGTFESYASEAELSPATVKRWRPVIESFVAHLGHDDAGRVGRADDRIAADALRKAGLPRMTSQPACPTRVSRVSCGPRAGAGVRGRGGGR
jgi:hypothetical protein